MLLWVIQSQYLSVNILFQQFAARHFLLYEFNFLVYLHFACYRLVICEWDYEVSRVRMYIAHWVYLLDLLLDI